MKGKYFLIVILVLVVGIGTGIYLKLNREVPPEKVYVAVEGEGKISVIDPARRSIFNTIDLGVEHEGELLSYSPHNVQVAPDGQTVWVTANAGSHTDHSFHIIPRAQAHGGDEEESDAVIIINPVTDSIVARIAIDPGVHLAHVVFTPDSAFVYITAQRAGIIYKINAKTYVVEKKIQAPGGSEPHGIRIDTAGLFAYVAFYEGRGFGVLDLTTDGLTFIPTKGKAVQAGVTSDGVYAMASLYDTKQLALYTASSKTLDYIDLPANARGPIQMYAIPGSHTVYLADQGNYLGAPNGELVYKIDLDSKSVTKEIKVGVAPHGVVISDDGKSAYVTNFVSGDVSIIDTGTDLEVTKIAVGREPNGISIWTK